MGVGNLALCLWTRYTEAEVLHQRVVGDKEKRLGSEDLGTLEEVNNLAHIYRGQRRRNEAEILYKRALAGTESLLGPEHQETLGVNITLQVPIKYRVISRQKQQVLAETRCFGPLIRTL
jgi:hypothetical protein